MTANPHSIDLPGFMAEHLERAEPDLLRSMLSSFIQALMSAEADAMCGAPYGARSPERVTSRNGYRVRDFDTRAGTVEVAIPKLREGSYFPDWLLERRKRAERALVSVVATCYLLGVSTRRMEKLVETLGITRLSKSQVSVMARELDEQVADFRTRPLDQGPYTFVAADALTMKVREGGRVVLVHVLTATGVNADGHREILGVDVTSAEDGAGWLAFFRDLTVRGLSGVSLVTSDAHTGLVGALGATLPGAVWQRCRTHYAANLMAVTPKSSWAWVKALLHSVYDQPDAASVHAQFDRIVAALADRLPRRGRPPRGRPRRHSGVHRLPQGAVAPDLEQQPPGAAEPGDPPPHRRGRDLPEPRRLDPPGRCGARRAARRMGRRSPLPRPRRPRPITPHEDQQHRLDKDQQRHPEGGQHPGRTHRIECCHRITR
jgi:putative transposase